MPERIGASRRGDGFPAGEDSHPLRRDSFHHCPARTPERIDQFAVEVGATTVDTGGACGMLSNDPERLGHAFDLLVVFASEYGLHPIFEFGKVAIGCNTGRGDAGAPTIVMDPTCHEHDRLNHTLLAAQKSGCMRLTENVSSIVQ
jgi:hypothetical protein